MTTPQPSRPWVAILAICALWALTMAANLGERELDNEEGRRAWPAREMLASGDYVLPTIHDRPYLAKPPLYFWMIAGAATATGAMDELATRLPSALAALATALAILAWLRGRTGDGVGGLAACLWLVSFEVHKKGTLGELETTLALWSFLSIACLWRGRHGGWRAAALGGLALACATLTKGPPALLFHGAAIAVLLWTEPAARRRFGVAAWAPFALGAAALVIWTTLVRARPEVQDALGTWQKELVGRGSNQVAVWAEERASLVFGLLAAMIPASLLWLVCARGTTRQTLRRDPAYRFVVRTAVLAVLLLALTPGVRVRYAFPVTPWIAVAAGLAIAAAEAEGEPAWRRVRWTLLLPGAIALGLVASPLYLDDELLPGVGPVEQLAILLIGLVAFAGMLGTRVRERPTRVAAACVLALSIPWGLERVHVPGRDRYGRRDGAQQIEFVVPEGQALHVAEWTNFNSLFYLDRDTAWIDDPAAAPPGSYVLIDPARLERWPADRPAPEPVGGAMLYGARRIVVRTR